MGEAVAIALREAGQVPVTGNGQHHARAIAD
jgi:hypothetical protein